MLSSAVISGKYVERFGAILSAKARGSGSAQRERESNCALVIVERLVHPRGMGAGKLRLIRSQRIALQPEPISKARQREQVAAVCFRILSTGIEFLLVRTRRGRWTFPKGGAQAGLSHAQSAALEAFEEAGVHGRIEEVAFVRYTRRKLAAENELGYVQAAVRAHLCEVLHLDVPQEANRNPTWFSATKAKRRLGEGRTRENGSELARVVDRAVARIRRLPARTMLQKDALLTVKFDASEINLPRLSHNSNIRSLRVGKSVEAHTKLVPSQDRGKVLQLGPSHPKRVT
jgi:8-oxo-dGTP pyrophosphatase MutT (NUDIX family)